VLPVFRNPLSVPARVRAMPDLVDRARLASIAVLAGFALLALALVSHIASTNTPLSLPGLSGKGQVLTVPGAGPETSGKSGPSSATPAAGAPAATGFVVPGAGSAAGNDTNQGNPADSGAPQGDQPRQVGITLGSGAPSQPGSTPQTPATPTTGGGNSGGGSNTAGTGSGQENGTQGSQPAGPSNNYGHSSPIPPPTAPSSGATGNGSKASGTPASGLDATSTSTSSSTATSAPDYAKSSGKNRSGHSK
jgi:hypothetical protein